MKGVLSVLVVATGLSLIGCAEPPRPRVPEPGDAVRALAEAIERDDPDAALGLLVDGPVAADRERFGRLWKDNRTELLSLAEQLRGRDAAVRASAQVELDTGETVTVVLEDGRWRLAGGVLDAQALATPLDAVSALRRAILRRDLSGLLRALSQERRAAFAASFDRSVRSTADPLDLRVETHGEQAVVHTSDGGEIHLRRQGGRWYVVEVR